MGAFVGFVSFRFHFVDFVSFRFVLVDFVSFRFVSFRFYFVSHFIGTQKNHLLTKGGGAWGLNVTSLEDPVVNQCPESETQDQPVCFLPLSSY
jgi:hypothetical protein